MKRITISEKRFIDTGYLKYCVYLLDWICFSFNAGAQQANLNDVAEKFDSYQAENIIEKVYVHTDRSFYMPGNILWFNIYITDGNSHLPLDMSKLAYVEILDPGNKPVLQAKINLAYGRGNGSFFIPSSVQTGQYLLRAYTSWMKNLSPDYFFHKQITIVNPYKPPGRTIPGDLPDYDIRFFPEGGRLVNGIRSKMAFKITDKNGRGADGKGMIIDENKDTIVQFSPVKFGMGNFLFTPASGHKYEAHFLVNGKEIIKNLPEINQQGYIMNLKENQSGELIIEVRQNAGSEDAPCFLLVHSGNMLESVQTSVFKENRAEFALRKDQLLAGISHFTVFNAERAPVCERLYFKRPAQKLVIDLETEKKDYGVREKVDLVGLTTNGQAASVSAYLSLSVFRLDPFEENEQPDICSYLYLNSDLYGFIESPAWYFENESEESDEALDNLMLTQGWRRFNWEFINDNKRENHGFIPEITGHVIIARVFDKSNGYGAAGVPVSLSVPARKFQFHISRSDSSGLVRFEMNHFSGTDEIVLQVLGTDAGKYSVQISNPFSDRFSEWSYPAFSMPVSLKDALSSRTLHVQIQNTYQPQKRLQFYSNESADSTEFYGKPDRVYNLDDYTRFTTMEEVMREYVPEVLVRKQGGEFHFRVVNAPVKVYFESDPLVLLDGAVVNNVDRLMTFDPLKIQSMDIISRKYYLGSFAFDGIVSYRTYDGDLGGQQPDPAMLILNYEAPQLKRQFYAPVYETENQKESRIPDCRELLYWSPDVESDKNGLFRSSFYTSDVTGRFMILIQGITADGAAGSKRIIINVVKDR